MKFPEQFVKETRPVNRRGLRLIHWLAGKVLAALLVPALCGAWPAFAAGPCTVTSNLDNGGAGQLRTLIADDTCGSINFQAGLPSPIVLNGTQLEIGRDLTINGPGAANLAISGNHASQIFEIDPGVTVAISGLTIENGLAKAGGGIHNEGALTLTNITVSGNTSAGGVGGGINNYGGTLTLTNSTVSGNTSAGSYGGGIANGAATLILTNSTVSGNTSSNSDGGGIGNQGIATVTNSTVSGNTAWGNGGGIANGSGFTGGGTVTLINSTVSGNTSGSGGAGIQNTSGGTLNVKNTIVANNKLAGGTVENCGGTGSSLGYNLSDDASCAFFTATGDLTNTPANLGPLQNNGGLTETLALLVGSAAIDHVPLAVCTDTDGTPISTDQRGVARPQGPACDIGAFELTAADAIPNLVTQVLKLNIKTGISNSLDAKLNAALGALDDINTHNDGAAVNALQAFINAVQAQSGGQIDEADADALINAAQQIIDALRG